MTTTGNLRCPVPVAPGIHIHQLIPWGDHVREHLMKASHIMVVQNSKLGWCLVPSHIPKFGIPYACELRSYCLVIPDK